VSCDGIVSGAALQLSHWHANTTPAEFKADTSTEIALRFIDSPQAEAWHDAVVINNHFDTDGLLSVWTLLEPDAARERRALLVAAAEAGDFDAWPDDPRGLWLDAAVRALVQDCEDDEQSYEIALAALPKLVDEIDSRADLWGPEWERIQSAQSEIESGLLVPVRMGALGIVHHKPGIQEIPGPLLTRELEGCVRWLLIFERDAALDYRYELPHHAWAETVKRPRIPPPPRRVLEALGDDWTDEGACGMTEVAHTQRPVQQSPDDVLEVLLAADPILADFPRDGVATERSDGPP
jgi:hypothetical protein